MALNIMNKQEFIDLCAVYALGALDGEDLARFRAALPVADTEMQTALSEALHGAEQFSLAAPEAAPSPAVKERLMQRVRAGALSTSAPRVPAQASSEPVRAASRGASRRESVLGRLFGMWLTPRPALAFAFTLLVLVAGLLTYVNSLSGNVRVKGKELAQAHERIRALEDTLSQKEALLEVIRARAMQVVVMSGTEASPAGYGKILWDPEGKTAVLQVELPPEPEGMDYQLWVIRDQKPVDAGVFQVSAREMRRAGMAGNGGLYKIDRLIETDRKRINAFAVTLEPKGGVPQPTGAMYLVGAVEI